MSKLPDRSRRILQLGGAGLALTLVALGTAAWALVRAEAERGRRHAEGRAEQWAGELLATIARLTTARDGAAWVGLDAAFGVVEPPCGRPFAALPAPVDEEGAYFAELARNDADESATALRLALASPDSVVRLRAALVIADRGGDARAALERARLPESLRRTRDGVLLGRLAGDAYATEIALAAIGSEDEDAAAALLVGTAPSEPDALGPVVRQRRLLRRLHDLASLVRAAPSIDDERRDRVLLEEGGGAVVGVVRRPESVGEVDAAWWIVRAPPGVLEDAGDMLKSPGVWWIGADDDVPAGASVHALPGPGGYRVVALADAWAMSSTLLIGGFSVAAAAAVAAFMAFARGVAHEARLARLRGEFVATVGHELRTPVAVIRSSAEALALGRASRDEDRAQLVAGIVRESERLSGLLGNVLDFARMEAGRRAFSFVACDVGEVVRETVDAHRAALDRADVVVSVDVAEGVPRIACDRDAIGAALVNLLDNAAKFSGARRDVEVRVTHDPEHVVVAVVDHGPGVPEAEKARVFERFFRGAADAVRETRGTGIGLALVRHAAEAHGGRVEIGDTPGGGARFRMLLPTEPGGGD